MKTKKIISVLLTLAVASSVFIGCGSKEDTKTEGNTSGEKVTLKMSVWDKDKTAYLQPVIDAYKAQNENVDIELVDISSAEYQDKLSVMLSGGSDDIDIITVKDTPGYSSMVNKGQLEPLTSYIEKDKVNLNLYSGTTEQMTIDNELYSLPFRSDFWVLYYNKDLFDKAGVEYPTNDMTWKQYEELARKMTSGSGAEAVYGSHYHTWRSTVQLPAVLDGKNSIIQEDYSFLKPFYEMVLGMQKDKVVMDYGSLKTGSIHYSGVFENEQIAMLPMGSWYIGTVIASHDKGTADMNWGIVKYPHADGVEPGTTVGTITSLGINSKSSKKDAAWDFIKFFSGEEGAKVVANSGTLPAIKTDSIVDTIAGTKGFPTDANSKEALNTVKTYLEMPVDSKSALIEIILNEEHDLIMTGSVDIDAGLKEMANRVKEELNK
ncbi:carbohydrate ABC transporter substrate-binding protein [Clostridium sartagoforme AAU1]|jgi:multiple sugar transport system substrate-binding protein|uniref:Carbohydrate ABC transporter substrate-binding protein n=1 Tax=Clostridium sartagoforme AAU1 TaxID=1202534 RepID=R9BV66_9CLOT|nr:sugar ABC transporter substrate-binding protein [Clostridium sartagoforme]EOR20948.1 carbohydrate ABC transporter substrate-binding protein [Clostridium sartagoforme AAU1]